MEKLNYKERLSDEIREGFGVDFPNIDHFQTAKSVIGIPQDVITEIIRKGNSIKLVGSTFLDGEGIASSFDMTLQMLPMGVDEIVDCIVGIFVGRNVEVKSSAIEAFINRLNQLPQHVEPVWGFYIDECLEPDHAEVITVATTKERK